jgi:hypothetical protein
MGIVGGRRARLSRHDRRSAIERAEVDPRGVELALAELLEPFSIVLLRIGITFSNNGPRRDISTIVRRCARAM